MATMGERVLAVLRWVPLLGALAVFAIWSLHDSNDLRFPDDAPWGIAAYGFAVVAIGTGVLRLPFRATRGLGPLFDIVLGVATLLDWYERYDYIADKAVEGRPVWRFGLTWTGRTRWLGRHGPRLAPRAAVARWSKIAELEQASVHAFEELARDLETLGAPELLVVRSRAAAAQEQHHADAAYRIVERLSGRFVERTTLAPLVRLRRKPSLRRLLGESWRDGCLGEGVAAECARHSARLAQDVDIAEFWSAVAADEQGHAELAWDVVEWIGEVDPCTLRSLAAASRPAPRKPSANLEPTLAYGLLDPATRRHCAARVEQRAHARIRALETRCT